MSKINVTRAALTMKEVAYDLRNVCTNDVVCALQDAEAHMWLLLEYITSAHNSDDKTKALAGEKLLAALDEQYTAEEDEEQQHDKEDQ